LSEAFDGSLAQSDGVTLPLFRKLDDALRDELRRRICSVNVAFLSELHALRIDLFLYQQGLDTTTPAGKAMFQMMGTFAEFERAMIQERVRAGLARARSEGKRLDRPPIPADLE
jgi:DNA invertase Pin-like site-specific DNA recombinase